MMGIDCFLASVDPDLAADSSVRAALEGRLPGYFAEGSAYGGQPPDIDLRIDSSRYDSYTAPAGYVLSVLELNIALEEILGPTEIHGNGVTKIGLLLADTFDPKPGIFGLMFDCGTDNDDYATVQRQGCAVFVGSIRKSVKSHGHPPSWFIEQVAFTASHELGHVFNLWHEDDPIRFMTPSDPNRMYPPGAFQFDETHREFLAKCSRSEYVQPGGSAFEDRDLLVPVPPSGPEDGRAAIGRLTLEVDITPREFWAFEPVELDVTLSLSPQAKRRRSVPDELDPGHERFDIWVTAPDGERRRLRSPVRYGRNNEQLRLAPGESIARDILIARDARGQVFRAAGRHRVQATFRLTESRLLLSNPVEVMVLPAKAGDAAYDEARSVLTRPSVVRLLTYRSRAHHQTMKLVAALAERCRVPRIAAAANYALGRSLLSAAARLTRPSRAQTCRDDALRHLGAAACAPQLSPHRRAAAERLLDQPVQP